MCHVLIDQYFPEKLSIEIEWEHVCASLNNPITSDKVKSTIYGNRFILTTIPHIHKTNGHEL